MRIRVMTKPALAVRKSPSANGHYVGRLSYGARMKVLSEAFECGYVRWYQVKLPDGVVGYVCGAGCEVQA